MNVVVAKRCGINDLYLGLHRSRLVFCTFMYRFVFSIFFSDGLNGSKRFRDVLMFKGLVTLLGSFEHLSHHVT